MAAESPLDEARTSLDPSQILKASKALLAHIRKAAQEEASKTTTRSLLDDPEDNDLPLAVAESPIWLTLTTKRHIHPSAKLKPGKIIVPNALNDPADTDATICLITADPQRAYKNIVASEAFPAALRSRITRVIDYSHIKAKISKSYEAQRKLASEHTVFLADDRIINRLPQALGKSFYKTTAKRPIPIVLMPARERVEGKRVKKDKKAKKTKEELEASEQSKFARPTEEIAAEIEKAVGAVAVNLSPSTDTSVRIGYASWSPEKIAQNADAVAAALVERFVPQKWKNVRSVYIKGHQTAALPIWLTDELWMDGGTDVLPEGEEERRILPSRGAKGDGEKANVGKKRKASDAEDAQPRSADGLTEGANGKEKRSKKKAKPSGNDDTLDAMISERKTKLTKQKADARRAIEA